MITRYSEDRVISNPPSLQAFTFRVATAALPVTIRQRFSSSSSRLLPAELRTQTALLFLMVGAALLLRVILVACVFRDVAAPTVDHERFGWEMGWTARSITLGHGFGSPFLPFTGATALVPPLYPLLLSFVFHLFGLYTAKSALVILCLNSFFSALTCLPIYFSLKQAVGERAAMLAGWSWVVFPYSIYFSADRVWDYALTALLFSTCFWAAQRIHRRSPLSTWFGVGLLFGITTLSNPSIATILPILLLFALLRVHRSQHPWLLRSLVTAVTFAAVIAPWALRNYHDLHIISPVRDGFWLEAYAGNNGDTFTSNAPWAHPASNPVEMQRYKAAGEVGYMEQKKQLTLAWIKTHPMAFAAVSLRRVVRFWTGFWSLRRSYLRLEPLDVPDIFFCTFLTVMMFRGLYRWWRQDRRKTLAYIALLILFPLPYYFSHSSPDYRQPIEPQVIALVTIGIFGLREHQNDTDFAQTLDADFESESESRAGGLIGCAANLGLQAGDG